jgi:hypothetical protein
MKESIELSEAFEAMGKRFFEMYPEIPHEWSMDSTDFQLTIKKINEKGFDLNLELFGDDVVLHCESMHQHITNLEKKPTPEFANEVFGVIYDYLTTDVRMKEFQSNGSPFKWVIESLSEDKWERGQSTGILFYNYFGKKTIEIFQNDYLPPRMSQSQPVVI